MAFRIFTLLEFYNNNNHDKALSITRVNNRVLSRFSVFTYHMYSDVIDIFILRNIAEIIEETRLVITTCPFMRASVRIGLGFSKCIITKILENTFKGWWRQRRAPAQLRFNRIPPKHIPHSKNSNLNSLEIRRKGNLLVQCLLPVLQRAFSPVLMRFFVCLFY